MGEKKEILDEITEKIVNLEEEEAKKLVKTALDKGVDPYLIINKSLGEAGKLLGKKYEDGTYALPELMVAADILSGISNIISSYMSERGIKQEEVGKVVIATVKGDIHDIGKNLVATMLRANGFKVYDLGRDVSSIDIIKKAIDEKADIIALSALMTTSMGYQKEVIELLKAMNKRNDFIVIIGGGSVTEEWASEIGADGYGEDALEAVEMAKKLIERKRGG